VVSGVLPDDVDQVQLETVSQGLPPVVGRQIEQHCAMLDEPSVQHGPIDVVMNRCVVEHDHRPTVVGRFRQTIKERPDRRARVGTGTECAEDRTGFSWRFGFESAWQAWTGNSERLKEKYDVERQNGDRRNRRDHGDRRAILINAHDILAASDPHQRRHRDR
jgi:hypothetical protein